MILVFYMKNKLYLVLSISLIFLSFGCQKSESSLVCIGKARKCSYVAVSSSLIGEEEMICDDYYGDVEVTFYYNEDEKWERAEFVTEYFEKDSNQDTFSELESNCDGKCDVEMKNGRIVLREELKKADFQNGNRDEMIKYMGYLDYNCK